MLNTTELQADSLAVDLEVEVPKVLPQEEVSTDDYFLMKANQKGQEWRNDESNAEAIKALRVGRESFWPEWTTGSEEEHYNKNLSRLTELYQGDQTFRAAVDKDISFHLKRKNPFTKEKRIDNPGNRLHCRSYILKELAVYYLLAERGYHRIVYPNGMPYAFKWVHENLITPEIGLQFGQWHVVNLKSRKKEVADSARLYGRSDRLLELPETDPEVQSFGKAMSPSPVVLTCSPTFFNQGITRGKMESRPKLNSKSSSSSSSLSSSDAGFSEGESSSSEEEVIFSAAQEIGVKVLVLCDKFSGENSSSSSYSPKDLRKLSYVMRVVRGRMEKIEIQPDDQSKQSVASSPCVPSSPWLQGSVTMFGEPPQKIITTSSAQQLTPPHSPHEVKENSFGM